MRRDRLVANGTPVDCNHQLIGCESNDRFSLLCGLWKTTASTAKSLVEEIRRRNRKRNRRERGIHTTSAGNQHRRVASQLRRRAFAIKKKEGGCNNSGTPTHSTPQSSLTDGGASSSSFPRKIIRKTGTPKSYQLSLLLLLSPLSCLWVHSGLLGRQSKMCWLSLAHTHTHTAPAFTIQTALPLCSYRFLFFVLCFESAFIVSTWTFSLHTDGLYRVGGWLKVFCVCVCVCVCGGWSYSGGVPRRLNTLKVRWTRSPGAATNVNRHWRTCPS